MAIPAQLLFISLKVEETHRVCKKCRRKKRIGLFPWAQRTNKDGSKSRYRLRHCQACERKKRKKWRREHAEERRAYERQWRKDNPKRAKKHDDKYNHSVKGRRARKRYEKTEKGRAAHARYRARLKLLTADLPIEVVRPYLLRMLNEANANYVSGGRIGAKSTEGGTAKLAEIVGIPKHRLHDIAHKQRLKSVSVDDCDRLAMHGDFSLVELYVRAEEWAALTGNNWPEGYHRKRSRRKPMKRETKADREQYVLALLQTREMGQGEIAMAMGYSSSSAVSKILQPMLKAGKIKRYRSRGAHQQYKYSLVA